MSKPLGQPSMVLLRYLSRLRFRARLMVGGQALVFTLAVGFAVLALVAALAGAVVTPTWARQFLG